MNQTGSYRLPLTIMRSIPLMVIGVMPGFWLLNQFGQRRIGGFLIRCSSLGRHFFRCSLSP